MFNQEHHRDSQEKKETPTTWPSPISRELLLKNMRPLMEILQLLKSLKENLIIDWERVLLGSSKSATTNSWHVLNQLGTQEGCDLEVSACSCSASFNVMYTSI